jgi:hypothetical protein
LNSPVINAMATNVFQAMPTIRSLNATLIVDTNP